jgi:hypothetical protein
MKKTNDLVRLRSVERLLVSRLRKFQDKRQRADTQRELDRIQSKIAQLTKAGESNG